MNMTHLLVVGDFNVPDVDWDKMFSSDPENHCSHRLIQAINDCFLVQQCLASNKIQRREASNILDLVFTNEEGMICRLDILPGLGNSDHVVLKFAIPQLGNLMFPGPC